MGAINSTQPVGATTEPFPRPVGTSTSWAAHGEPSETTQATRTPGARYRAKFLNIRIVLSTDFAIKRPRPFCAIEPATATVGAWTSTRFECIVNSCLNEWHAGLHFVLRFASIGWAHAVRRLAEPLRHVPRH